MSWTSLISTDDDINRKLGVGLVSILLISVLFMGCVEEESQEYSQESPEDAFSLFVERINDEDGDGVIELFDTQFLDDDFWEESSEQQEGLNSTRDAIDNGELEIHSYEINVTYLEDMDEDSSPLNRTQAENFKDGINEFENFTATVDDLCMVKYEWNSTVDEDSFLEDLADSGESEQSEGFLPMVEINDEWYIGFISYMFMGDTGGDEVTAIAGAISHRHGTSFQIIHLSTPSSADPEDVKITVFGEDNVKLDEGYIEKWAGLVDGEVVDGSVFNVDDISPTEITEEDIKEVVMRIEGYEGTISVEI